MNVKKAVIPIAGRGTRFLPATKAISKELIPILNRPMIEYVMDEVVNSGIDEVIFITSRNSTATENFYSPDIELEDFLANANKEAERELVASIGRKIKVSTVLQTEQFGLGHAILQAKKLLTGEEAFAILLPDDLTIGSFKPVISQLIDIHEKYNASVIGVMEVPREKVHMYGVIELEKQLSETTYDMKSMVEKPKADKAPSLLATPGRYVLSTEIFEHLEKIPRGSGGEFQLTDAISSLCNEQTVLAHKFEGKRYDTGNLAGYLKATIDFALKDKELSKVLKDHLDEVL